MLITGLLLSVLAGLYASMVGMPFEHFFVLLVLCAGAGAFVQASEPE